MTKNTQTLIICPPSMKKYATEEENKKVTFNNVKIMTTSELKENFFFSTNIKTIIEICDKLKCSISYAKSIIKHLYYIDVETNYNALCNNEQILLKINSLQELKKYLIEKNLLIENDLFKNKLASCQIKFNYFDYMNHEDRWLYRKAMNKDYEQPNLKELKLKEIYEFTSSIDEYNFVFDNIASILKEDKEKYKDIVILNPTAASSYTLDRISKQYKIDLDMEKSTKIAYTKIAKDFIEELDYSSINDALNSIKSIYIDDVVSPRLEKNQVIYNTILDIANKYVSFNNIDDYKKYIIEEINQTTISNGRLTNAIRVRDIESYQPQDNDIVFIINANDGVINTAFKNTDYLNDIQKVLIGMPSSVENTEDNKELIKQKIIKIKNHTITYHINSGFEKEAPSFLNDFVAYLPNENTKERPKRNIIKNAKISNNISFSKQKDFYNYINKKDTKNFDKEYHFLKNEFEKQINPYSSLYDIEDQAKVKEFIYEYYLKKKHLLLSYTTMNDFYNCPFMFYLKNILNIDDRESTFSLAIGNIFHGVLKNIYNSNFDFEKEFEREVAKQDITTNNNKEYLLLQKLKEELKFVICVIKEHNDNSDFVSKEFEKEVYVKLDKVKELDVKFKGTIDKIMSYEDKDNNKTYFSIIDYKTGEAEIDPMAMEHGVGLQLPVYLYLTRYIYPNCEFAGYYLQKILHEESKTIKNKTRNDIRKEESKLVGYTINNESIIKKFDHSYQNSDFVKSLGFTKGDKKAPSRPKTNAKLFDENKINEHIELVKEKINNAYKSILNGDFPINPYIDNSGNYKGCEYCKFSDICYKFLATEVEKDGD